MGPRLDLRQSQSLVMTPQLQQAIRLLALSNLEIEAFIAEEVEKNPLLEAGVDEAPEIVEPLFEERVAEADTFLDAQSTAVMKVQTSTRWLRLPRVCKNI